MAEYPQNGVRASFMKMTEVGAAKRISFSMRQYLFSSLWSKVFKRKIIENRGLRFSTDLSIGEDQLFIFSYAMHIQSISSIDALLYNVDVSNENSLSRKGRHYLTGQLMEVNRRMYAAYRQRSIRRSRRIIMRWHLHG